MLPRRSKLSGPGRNDWACRFFVDIDRPLPPAEAGRCE